MAKRPVVLFGAAFLFTVTAALFAPSLLLPPALVLGFCLVFFRRQRTLLTVLSLGVLTAGLCCGVFLSRSAATGRLVGDEYSVTGTLFQTEDGQFVDARFPDGSRHTVQLYPPVSMIALGQRISCDVEISSARYDSNLYALSGGTLLRGEPSSVTVLPPEGSSLPLTLRALLLRNRLTEQFLELNRSPATAVTCGVLFSSQTAISPAIQQAFRRSGMAHLLSVSGLHLSILCWMVLTVVRRMGGGRTAQTIAAVAAALLVYLAAGMSPGAFRAAIMTILTLVAGLVLRRSDGLTSLSVAAVLLCGFCPPMIADLSFLLSFLSVLGILTLAPRLAERWRQWVIARRGRCGKALGALLAATAVSVSAQLMTAPIVAWQFGAVPMLAIVLSLLAIPLCYPLLLCGLLATAATLLGWSAAAAILLLCANICSLLLTLLAQCAVALPFCALPTRFPLDFLTVGLGLFWGILAAVLPNGRPRRGLWSCAVITTCCAVIASLALTHSTVTVLSSPITHSLILADRTGAVVLQSDTNGYRQSLDRSLLQRLGYADAQWITLPLDAPVLLLPGCSAYSTSPYSTEIMIGSTKVVKFGAVYDTIIRYGGTVPEKDAILVDRAGNLLSLGGDRYVLRQDGGSSLRLLR